MSSVEIVVAVVIAVGLIGIVVPMLPGSLLVIAAILVWSTEVGGSTAWTVFGIAAALVLTGGVVKYAVPGKRLKGSGVPTSTLWFGAALGIVGFFVVPVIGLPLGFVLGVYLAERRRVDHSRAWPSTVDAIRAVGLGLLIEFGFAFLATITWIVGVAST